MSTEPKRQIDKFRDLARELETDDDEAAFDERLKKLAGAPSGKAHPCRDCGGAGTVTKAQDIVAAPEPPPIEAEPCARCGGSGIEP